MGERTLFGVVLDARGDGCGLDGPDADGQMDLLLIVAMTLEHDEGGHLQTPDYHSLNLHAHQAELRSRKWVRGHDTRKQSCVICQSAKQDKRRTEIAHHFFQKVLDQLFGLVYY